MLNCKSNGNFYSRITSLMFHCSIIKKCERSFVKLCFDLCVCKLKLNF